MYIYFQKIRDSRFTIVVRLCATSVEYISELRYFRTVAEPCLVSATQELFLAFATGEYKSGFGIPAYNRQPPAANAGHKSSDLCNTTWLDAVKIRIPISTQTYLQAAVRVAATSKASIGPVVGLTSSHRMSALAPVRKRLQSVYFFRRNMRLSSAALLLTRPSSTSTGETIHLEL